MINEGIVLLVIQFFSALLLLLNKYYIRRKKSAGWVYGIAGGAVAGVYFYFQIIWQNKENLWIMVVMSVAIVVLMMYGYLIAYSKEREGIKHFLREWNIWFKTAVLVVTLVVCSLFLVEALTSSIVLGQFFYALGFLFGTLLLAFDNKVMSIMGWILYFIANSILAYVMFNTDSLILGAFQILSACIAIEGIVKELKK